MKKETTKKSKLWIWIVVAALLLLAAGGTVLAFVLGGGQENPDNTPGTNLPTGPRADLYWNLDKEFYTATSQTGLSTREADANGQFKMRFAYNGEIVEFVIIDKKLVNVIDTQDVLGLVFDENGVVIDQINVRDLATEVGKKVYVKNATADTIVANSSMAMNGMELNLKLGQYAEIYDLRADSENFGKKITTADLQILDCMTVYANADGDVTHVFLISSAVRSKIYWRANLWTSDAQNAAGFTVDENGYTILPFYADGEYVEVKTKNPAVVDYYATRGRHNGFTGLVFDDEGYCVDRIDAAVGIAGQMVAYAVDITEINGNSIKAKHNISTTGDSWEGEIPEDAAIYAQGSWAYSEGIMGKKLSVNDLQVNDRLTIFTDMEGNVVQIGVTNRIYNIKPAFSNRQNYDAKTRTTTRVKDTEGYYTYTFIDEKGLHYYKTKDQKLANFLDSYPEKVYGLVLKGDRIVKAYEYENLYGQVRFCTALYVDSINSSIISCTDATKANGYTGVLSDDVVVLDISGDSKQWGQKIKLKVGDCMIAFKNLQQEVCMIYVYKRSMGGQPYVNTTPNPSRAPEITYDSADPTKIVSALWRYQMTDVNGKKVELTLDAKYNKKTGEYDNKHLQSRIDSASKGIIALEVSGTKIKDAHAVGNMASGNAVETTIITVAGTSDFQYKTSANPDAEIFPGWTGKEGLKMINLSPQIKSYKGEKLSGGMKVGDVYYMIRNRANESTVLYLISRGMQKDLYFVKNYTKDAETGIYTFNLMYQGKAKTFTVEDDALATSLIGMANGAVLKLDGSKIVGVYDSSNSTDAYSAMVSNWDVSKISGKKLTLAMNIPTTTTKVGETQEVDITGAKIYNLSPNAGDNFGKTTTLKKGDRIRVYIDRNGEVSYVHVLVRGAARTALCPHCNKKVTWNPLLAGSDFTIGTAHYYVYDDMEITNRLNLTGDVGKYEIILDLNGKTVTHIGDADRMIMINFGNTLTVLDTSEGETGVLQSYGWNGNGNVVQVTYGSTLNLLSGTLKHINAEGRVSVNMGGVIFSYSEGSYDRNKINISGGKIVGGVVTHNSGGTATGAIHAFKTDIVMTGGAIYGGTADRGGNVNLVDGSVFTMKGGEIHSGTARALGGNIFANAGTVVNIEGGKIYGGTAASGGGNIYAYGASISVTSGAVTDGSGSAAGQNISLNSSSTLYLNNVAVSGGIYAASSCVILVEGDTKVDAEGIRLDKGGVLLVDQLADTAYLPVYADGNFAKAPEGSNVDVEAYMNKQIVATGSDCKLSAETIGGEKWLVAKVPSATEIAQEIIEKANKMTTDGVFNAGGIVTAECPVCNKTVEWTPLTAPAAASTPLTAGHYYLNEEINLTAKGGFLISGTGAAICVHLNGKTYSQALDVGQEGAFKVSADTTLNLMGTGTVIGVGTEVAPYGFTGSAIDARGNVNIYGGTYKAGVANRPAVGSWNATGNIKMYGGEIVKGDAITDASSAGSSNVNIRLGEFTLYGGTISGGMAEKGGNVIIHGGTFTVNGGTIDGDVYVGSATVNINNGANIAATNGGLTLAGATVKLADDLAEGTEVYISDPAGAGAGLTVANAKAGDYANTFIKAADAEQTVKVNADNQLYIPAVAAIPTVDEIDDMLDTPVPAGQEYHTSICPICRKEATWIPLTAPAAAATPLTAGHYYLKEDINLTATGGFLTSGTDAVICVHLNGKTYSQALDVGQEGAFKVAAGTTLNLMDGSANAGTVIGVGTEVAPYGFTGAAIDARSNVNIYGGTYKAGVANRPAVGSWNATGNITMYGGEIVKGDAITDASSAGSSNVNVRLGAFTLYGGTISGGMAEKGGNVIIHGGTFTVNGGTIDGDVYVGSATVNINNGANIAATNGGLTLAGATVNLADDLTDDTKVYISDTTGDGAPLTVANAKAASYAQIIICAADAAKVVKANAENQLYIAAAQ